MKADLKNAEERADRDKREREAEILALLLLLFGRAERYADEAARHNNDPYAAMAAVLLGNRQMEQPGGQQRLAALLMLSDLDGFHRTELILHGERLRYRPSEDYQSLAAIALSQMLSTLSRRVASAMAHVGGGLVNLRRAIRHAFIAGGYSRESTNGPWNLRTASIGLVGQAYNAGYWNGWTRPDIADFVRGFRYVAVLDNRTSDICRAYEAVKLPRNHPWFLTHFPLNHPRCRSMVIPILGPFERTPEEDIPYAPPPTPGYGRAPANFTAQAWL